jgi:hypothetical protein
MADIASGLARSLGRGGPLPGDPTTRRHVKLLETDAYQAWAIAWPRRTGLELHDHGGSLGILRVVSGELVEMFTDLATGAPLRTHHVGPGEAVELPVTRVHDVWNPGQTEAVSVHVYSLPLATMTFYDHRPEHYLEPKRTELVSEP